MGTGAFYLWLDEEKVFGRKESSFGRGESLQIFINLDRWQLTTSQRRVQEMRATSIQRS